MNPIIDSMQRTLAAQREAFLAHPYPSLAERKQKLRALKQQLRRYQDRIAVAVDADFGGRSVTETKLIEVMGPILEINHALSSLRRWMRPQRRHTELLFLTNSARVEYQPKGVVGIITPWNFPLYLALGPLVAALAAGNRAMIKMSELSPRTTELLTKMLGEIFPTDEVAVFGGEVEESQAFSRLPFNHLVFTGSPAVGHHVMKAASENLVPVTLELGGKSPALIGPDADFADAAKRIAHGKAFSSGQVCLAPDYALVKRGSEARSRIRWRRLSSTCIRRPWTTRTTPRWSATVTRNACASSWRTPKPRAGASCPRAKDGAGRRISLKIVTGVRDDMRIAQEEIFGPILPIMSYDSLDGAIAYVTARPRPLGFYVFGLGGDALADLKRRTHAGGVSINDWGWHAFNHDLPFGGIGNSGMGSYHGVEGFRELSHAKAVYKRHRFFPVGLFYPPYGGIVPKLAMRLYLGKADPASARDASERAIAVR